MGTLTSLLSVADNSGCITYFRSRTVLQRKQAWQIWSWLNLINTWSPIVFFIKYSPALKIIWRLKNCCGSYLLERFIHSVALQSRASNSFQNVNSASSPGPCVRKIFLVGILWTFKFLCWNLQFKWYWIEKKLSAIFSQTSGPVLCKLDMTPLYSCWITTKCLQFDSRLFESNIMYLKLQFTLHFDCFKEWTNGPNV